MSLIISIIVGIIAVVSGGLLIVNLREPLTSLKDMFIAFVDLVTDNAIWFIFVLLIFVIAFSLIKKAKFSPIDINSKKQQKIDNKYRQDSFNAKERQQALDNKYRQDELNLREKELKYKKKRLKKTKNSSSEKQEFMQHSFTKKQLNSLYDNNNLDNIKLTRK